MLVLTFTVFAQVIIRILDVLAHSVKVARVLWVILPDFLDLYKLQQFVLLTLQAKCCIHSLEPKLRCGQATFLLQVRFNAMLKTWLLSHHFVITRIFLMQSLILLFPLLLQIFRKTVDRARWILKLILWRDLVSCKLVRDLELLSHLCQAFPLFSSLWQF